MAEFILISPQKLPTGRDIRLTEALGATENNARSENIALCGGLAHGDTPEMTFYLRSQFDNSYQACHEFSIPAPLYCLKLFKLQNLVISRAINRRFAVALPSLCHRFILAYVFHPRSAHRSTAGIWSGARCR
jgi:hypothetical protein